MLPLRRTDGLARGMSIGIRTDIFGLNWKKSKTKKREIRVMADSKGLSQTQMISDIHKNVGDLNTGLAVMNSRMSTQETQIGTIFKKLDERPVAGSCIQGERNANCVKSLAAAGTIITTGFSAAIGYLFYTNK